MGRSKVWAGSLLTALLLLLPLLGSIALPSATATSQPFQVQQASQSSPLMIWRKSVREVGVHANNKVYGTLVVKLYSDRVCAVNKASSINYNKKRLRSVSIYSTAAGVRRTDKGKFRVRAGKICMPTTGGDVMRVSALTASRKTTYKGFVIHLRARAGQSLIVSY